MLAHKLKVTVPLAALALGVLGYAALAGPPPDPPATTPVVRLRADEPKAGAKGPNRLLFWREGKLVTCDPDGKNERELDLKDGQPAPAGVRLSPDGKQVAFLVSPKAKSEPTLGKFVAQSTIPALHVRPLDGEAGPGTDLGVTCEVFCWSPDGTQLACTVPIGDKPDREPEMESFVVTVKSKEKTALKLPANQVITDWAADGRFLTTSVSGKNPDAAKARLHLMNRDGTEHKSLAPDADAAFARVSPDGARALCTRLEFKKETPAEKKAREDAGRRFPEPKFTLAVLDLKTGTLAPVGDVPENAEIGQGYGWSPDGKRIAYSWREKHEGKPEDVQNKETESHLVVCDPDGKNAETVVSVKGKGQWHVTLGGVSWR